MQPGPPPGPYPPFGGPPPGFVPPNMPPGGYGAPPGTMGPSGSGQQTDPFAIVSLTSGILSLVIGWCCSLAFVLGPLALVMGFVAISRINGQPHLYTGKPLAIAGIACGALSLLIGIGLFFLGVGMSVLDRMM